MSDPQITLGSFMNQAERVGRQFVSGNRQAAIEMLFEEIDGTRGQCTSVAVFALALEGFTDPAVAKDFQRYALHEMIQRYHHARC